MIGRTLSHYRPPRPQARQCHDRQGSGVKSLDFGLAKLQVRKDSGSEAATLEKGVTTPGAVLGTVGYLSPEPSIAVLPFANMSADPEQEYFCDGIAEDIINASTRVRNLRVPERQRPRSRNADIRETGEKLNVSHVLEASVRKAGNRIRITVQLINVDDEPDVKGVARLRSGGHRRAGARARNLEGHRPRHRGGKRFEILRCGGTLRAWRCRPVPQPSRGSGR